MRTIRCYSGRGVTLSLVAAVGLWGAVVTLAEPQDTQPDGRDASFIKEAAQHGQAEVQLGNLAAERGEHAQIKQLGQTLARDHSKANQELMPIAAKCGVSLPTALGTAEHVEAHDLQGKTGGDFDKVFAEQAIKAHEADIDKYQKALQETKEADIKAFIEKNLPVLREHLQMARSAGAAVGVDEKILASADRYFPVQQAEMPGTVAVNEVQRVRDVGTAPGSQTGAAFGGDVPAVPADKAPVGDLKHPSYSNLPAPVQTALRAEGDPQNIRDIKLTTHKGQTVYIIKTVGNDGKRVTLHIAEDGTVQRSNWFGRMFGR